MRWMGERDDGDLAVGKLKKNKPVGDQRGGPKSALMRAACKAPDPTQASSTRAWLAWGL
jgi:hypothetical protein